MAKIVGVQTLVQVIGSQVVIVTNCVLVPEAGNTDTVGQPLLAQEFQCNTVYNVTKSKTVLNNDITASAKAQAASYTNVAIANGDVLIPQMT